MRKPLSAFTNSELVICAGRRGAFYPHPARGSLELLHSPPETGRQSTSCTTDGTSRSTKHALPTTGVLPSASTSGRVTTTAKEDGAHINLLRSHANISPFGSTDAHGKDHSTEPCLHGEDHAIWPRHDEDQAGALLSTLWSFRVAMS